MSSTESRTFEIGTVLNDKWVILEFIDTGGMGEVYRAHQLNLKRDVAIILRVTGYGALAYVRFFGLRLPREKEWFFAVTKGELAGEDSAPTPSESAQGMMMGDMHGRTQTSRSPVQRPESSMSPVTPVIMFKPNDFGIRQLNKNIGEWGVRIIEAVGNESGSETEYVILGGPAGRETDTVLSAVRRNPWEAFEEVGFRCVRDAPRGAR
ncbi:MAG: SUMF1/EgtB/PvdO family nonheme iron enzyme [Desulfoferrobacter sp.]